MWHTNVSSPSKKLDIIFLAQFIGLIFSTTKKKIFFLHFFYPSLHTYVTLQQVACVCVCGWRM